MSDKETIAVLLAALKAVEWRGGQDSHGCGICPSCEWASGEGHADDCQLADAIRKGEGAS